MPPSVPARMTTRARWYLIIAAGRHLLTAGSALAVPSAFRETSFLPILEVAPLLFWALLLAGAGTVCGLAAVRRSETLARLGLMWSATSTAVVSAGLVIAVITGDLTNPSGPILWTALALKDFTVCADPLRSPFEALADRLEGGEHPREAA